MVEKCLKMVFRSSFGHKVTLAVFGRLVYSRLYVKPYPDLYA